MPLTINPADYGQSSIGNLAYIAGTLHGEVKPGAGIKERAMIADVGANRAPQGGRYGSISQANGTQLSGAAAYLSDPNQFSTWRPTEENAYKNATSMRDAVFAVAKDPSAFDRLSPAMQQNLTATLAAARGVYGSGELRGISGGSTFYSVPSVLSPARAAEHAARGSDYGIDVGGNVFYGDDTAQSLAVSKAARAFDYDGAVSKLTNNLPSGFPGSGNALASKLTPPSNDDFGGVARIYGDVFPGSVRSGGIGDVIETGDPTEFANFGAPTGTVGNPNFGNGVDPLGYDPIRNPANPVVNPPEPPARPSDADIDLRGPVDKFSDAITAGLENAGNTAANAAGQVGGLLSGLLPGNTATQPAPGPTDFSGIDVSGGVPNGSFGAGIRPDQPAPSPTAFGGKFDAAQYLAANPDVARDAYYAQNPFNHYLQFGLNEGRAIDTRGDKFDPSKYLSQNADVLQAGMDPLMHYAKFGAAEGRAAPIVGPDGTVQFAPSFAQGLTIGPQAAGTIGPTQAPTIGPSGIFDAAAYLRANPDVAADKNASANPLEHFLRFGGDEGRVIDDNGDKFDAKTYEAQNADVLASGMDPLLHYVKFGQAEGRMAPIIGPDGTVRLVSNLGLASPVASDLAGQLIQAEEAQRRGPSANETGLTIGPQGAAPTIGAPGLIPTVGPQSEVTAQNFDGQAYKAANPDVAASGIDPWVHYSQMGRYEGRQAPTLANPYNFTDANVSGGVGNGSFKGFDPSAYLAANPDVARDATYSKNPLLHYEQFGFNEGRAIDPAGHAVAKNFDPSAYLAANPDVAASRMDPLQHLLQFGLAEGRAVPTGNNPYSFGSYNVAQGAGPTGNGSFGTGIGQGLSLTPAQTIGAPAPTQTIGALQVPTIAAGPAVNAAQGLGSYGFSNANVGNALGATPQSFGSLYGTSNLGMDVGQPQAQTGGIGEFGFSNANVGGFDVNGFGGAAPQASGGEAYGPPTYSSNFNPQSSQNAYLDSQVNAANASNAALDAFNPAIRTGMFTSSTGDPGIYKAAADYSVATLAINQANLAKPPAAAAAPVNVPRVAQGAFAPAPFFGRW